MKTCKVSRVSDIPHSISILPSAILAAATIGTFNVVIESEGGPTDISLSKYQNFCLLYETVPFTCHVRLIFFSISLILRVLVIQNVEYVKEPKSIWPSFLHDGLYFVCHEVLRIQHVEEVHPSVNWNGSFNPSIERGSSFSDNKLLKELYWFG